MQSKFGDSYVYIFEEKDTDAGARKYFKIGIASHNKTDESIKHWSKYRDRNVPVSIIRRIADLQTGNPRRIEVYAVIKFTDKAYSRKAESKLHDIFRDKVCAVPEWFSLSEIDLESCLGYSTQFEGYLEHELFLPS